jgi:hypothetical protein
MTGSITVRRVLAASAIAEAVTGIVLAVVPEVVTSLLFGVETSRHWTPLGRVAGVACWRSAWRAGPERPSSMNRRGLPARC